MQAAILLKVRERETVTIGRNTTDFPANKIQINSLFISTRHCQLVPEEGRLLLTDTSRNGTWITSTTSTSPDAIISSPSSRIKSVKSIHNTTVSLEPNTHIIFIPPTLCKVLTEIVGLHFTGLDLTREFYHLECIKLNSLLENRHLMIFFNHLGFGKDKVYNFNNGVLAGKDIAKLPRKRPYPITERIVENKDDTTTDCKHGSKESVSSPLECSPPSKSAKVELKRCECCMKELRVTELPEHKPHCKVEVDTSSCKLYKRISLENCMKCFREFPVTELIDHSENCTVSSVAKCPVSGSLEKRRHSNPL